MKNTFATLSKIFGKSHAKDLMLTHPWKWEVSDLTPDPL